MVTVTEEGRAFYQARLSIFGFCLFVLAGGSWLAMALAQELGAQPAERHAFSLGGVLHLTNALLAGALWLATRSGKRGGSALHALDILVTLGLTAVWALVGALLPDAVIAGFVALLSFVTGSLARAIVVPSTAKRTLVLGLIGAGLLVAASIFRSEPGQSVLGSAIASCSWAVSGVTLATVASHTIFGLRREVQRAQVLGQYTLESKIGEGGMGVVWRASHALLRRPTAVKLLQSARAGEPEMLRFEREVQLSARLTHPNSVAIYDYGRTRDGIFYYAMEFLDGVDLERLVAQHGAMPPGRVVHVLSQICGALAEAHDLGLVHRDVKPANILLSPRKNEHEFAKIVDYGLVKHIETKAEQSDESSADTITGTPLYMSPETIQAPDSVDGRSDLYALGAVAWFLLVGRPPFDGNTIVEVCAKHLHTPPARPSEALGRQLPSDLEDIVLGCLEKDPQARPADARRLRSALMACSVAGSWTEVEAGAFWQARAERRLAVPVGIGGRTINLDIEARRAVARAAVS
jgi:serine/threonine-protein kinase